MSSQSDAADLLQTNLSLVREMYLEQKVSANAIALHFGVKPSAVYYMLEKHQMECRGNDFYRRKYRLNQEYFHSIDSPDKAYFLGFLYADGSVNVKKKTVNLHLQERDKYILDKMRACLDTDKPLYLIPKRQPTWSDQWDLQLSGKRLIEDLVRLGCTQKKSLTLDFPSLAQVPRDLLHHFVRGYFDGDGCVTVSSKNASAISIFFAVTEQFGTNLKQVLSDEAQIRSAVRSLKDTPIHRLSFGGRNQAKKLFAWMYRDSEGLRLVRKHEKFKTVCC